VDKTLTCDCGFTAQARDDVGLATEVRRHAWEAHRMSDRHPRPTTDRNRNGGAMKNLALTAIIGRPAEFTCDELWQLGPLLGPLGGTSYGYLVS
jgi:hypothetical protein